MWSWVTIQNCIYNKMLNCRRGSRGGEKSEFSPPLFWAPFFLSFSYPSNIEIIFDFSDIITKIHPPFQNPWSALELWLVLHTPICHAVGKWSHGCAIRGEWMPSTFTCHLPALHWLPFQSITLLNISNGFWHFWKQFCPRKVCKRKLGLMSRARVVLLNLMFHNKGSDHAWACCAHILL